MVEADIHLKPLHTSILDMYKVFETLVCCLKGIWLHLYTITPAKFSQVLGIQVHLRSGNDAIMSWLSLTSTSDHFIHTQSYKKSLRHWNAVSRAYGCTLIPLHWPSCPQIWEFRFIWGVEMMSQLHGWGWHHLKPFHTFILDMYKMSETLVCCLKGIWLHPYTITLAKFSWVLGIRVHLKSGKTAIMSWLRLTSSSDYFIHPC
jgi:hypothetical protein